MAGKRAAGSRTGRTAAPAATTSGDQIHARYTVPFRVQVRYIPLLNRGTAFSNGGAALFLVFALLNLVSGDRTAATFGLALAVFIFSGYYCVPFGWYTLRKNRAAAEAPVDLTATGEGIRLASASAEFEVAWAEIRRIRETKDCFFVFARYPRAFFLPTTAFDPAALDRFRRLAAAKTRLQQG